MTPDSVLATDKDRDRGVSVECGEDNRGDGTDRAEDGFWYLGTEVERFNLFNEPSEIAPWLPILFWFIELKLRGVTFDESFFWRPASAKGFAVPPVDIMPCTRDSGTLFFVIDVGQITGVLECRGLPVFTVTIL